MAYIGRQPAAAPLTSADITNGIIVNDDIAAGAAIEQTKLATLSITDSNIADGALAQAKISGLSTALSGKQALDAGLTSISGLTTAADKMIYTTASDTYAVADLTTAGRALLDDADAAAQRTTLGVSNFADLTADQTFTAANRGTITAVTPAASVTFDLTTTNNFSLTLVSGSADPTLNFSTLTSAMVGQSGNIYLDNVSGGTQKTISKASNILMTSAEFNALSQTAGKYWLSYFVVNTTNVVVTASAALS